MLPKGSPALYCNGGATSARLVMRGYLIWRVMLQLEDDLQKEVKQVRYALEGDLKSFGKGFTVIEQVTPLVIPKILLLASAQDVFGRGGWTAPAQQGSLDLTWHAPPASSALKPVCMCICSAGPMRPATCQSPFLHA